MDELPIVLLGIRSSWREDADTTPAQLVYGAALRLPGEMIPGAVRPAGADAQFLRCLQDSMRLQAAPPTRHHCDPKSYIPSTLSNAGAVYVRHDARRTPLQRPYDGPFRVLSRSDKTFLVSRNGTPVTVSVDRLKPAFGQEFFPVDLSPRKPRVRIPGNHQRPRPPLSPGSGPRDLEASLRPSTKTRSGRISRPPDRLKI